MRWLFFAAFTMLHRLRALTGLIGIVDFLPRKRRARSGLRSPQLTWWPCRTNSCASSDPVAPEPSIKIRMVEERSEDSCRYQIGLPGLLQPGRGKYREK